MRKSGWPKFERQQGKNLKPWTWTRLSGPIKTTGENIQFYVVASNEFDFDVDDLQIVKTETAEKEQTTDNLLTNPGAQKPITSPWSCVGCSLSQNKWSSHDGSHSFLVHNRPARWAGLSYDDSSVLKPNKIYKFSALVFHYGETDSDFVVTVKLGVKLYDFQFKRVVKGKTWTKLSGDISVEGPYERLFFYSEVRFID